MTAHESPEGLAPAGWRLLAQSVAPFPAPGWRDDLAQRLGHRPRRMGEWTEFALHGALTCLAAAGEAHLPASARLRVLSRTGPEQVQRQALAQLRQGLPMPFSFMQSQPALSLAAMAQALKWQGDAAFLPVDELPLVIRLSLCGAEPEGLLLGVVDERAEGLSSHWWRWVR